MVRAYYGIDTWGELWLRIMARLTKNKEYLQKLSDVRTRRMAKKFTTDDCIKIKDVRLPLLDEERAHWLWGGMLEDTFGSYYYFDDRYDEEIFNLCDYVLGEGLYGCVNDNVNVTVNPGDIVIDAGSWIGDFAAYSSIKVNGGG